MTPDVCPTCKHIHVRSDVKALDRFNVRVAGYQTPDGVIHETREAGQAHLCAQRSGDYPNGASQ